jgi:hypothetical protein
VKVTVTFFGDAPVSLARLMLQSVRKYMDCPIIQLTDETTPKLDLADEVQRLPYEGDFGDFRLKHFINVSGDVLHLDYDVILNKNVSGVFDQDFDVAMCKRMTTFNMGVIFSKNTEFWKDVHARYKSIPIKTWTLIQTATTETAKKSKHKYKVLELPWKTYNYPPGTEDEDVSNRAIVHYKGERKKWMDKDGYKGWQLVRGMM